MSPRTERPPTAAGRRPARPYHATEQGSHGRETAWDRAAPRDGRSRRSQRRPAHPTRPRECGAPETRSAQASGRRQRSRPTGARPPRTPPPRARPREPIPGTAGSRATGLAWSSAAAPRHEAGPRSGPRPPAAATPRGTAAWREATTVSKGAPSIDRIGTNAATVDAAVGLLTTTLGAGLYSHDGLSELDAYEQGLGLKATVDTGLVGAAVSQILTPDDMDYYDVFGAAAHERLK